MWYLPPSALACMFLSSQLLLEEISLVLFHNKHLEAILDRAETGKQKMKLR
jgi:hypothetical protein